MAKSNWSRKETILAFSLYCKIPFGKINKTNPQVVELATLIGRSPSAVGMKLCNFGRFDPELQNRNISGLTNGSKMDEVVWNDYSNNAEDLVVESAKILSEYTHTPITEQVYLFDLPELPEGEEKERIITTRLNQRFFRDVLLSSYHSTCCITGINIPAFLIASHIKPWRVSDPTTERTSPSNGLLLNALHDRAFDNGFITINTSFELLISPSLFREMSVETYNNWFAVFEGKKIQLPEKFLPSKHFIEYHNDVVFRRK